MSILNLTRKFIPKVSTLKVDNIEAVKKIPENILTTMFQNGDKTIVKVGVNDSIAVRILEGKINTVFTDGLNECNGVKLVAKGLDGNPIEFPMHAVRGLESRLLNQTNLEKQLKTYDYYLDKTTKPKIFYNVSGTQINGNLVAKENPFIAQIKSVLDKFFKQGHEETIIPYEAISKTPFDSNAMISQYERTSAGWNMKLTTVGEKEHHIKLWG